VEFVGHLYEILDLAAAASVALLAPILLSTCNNQLSHIESQIQAKNHQYFIEL
jgi:hypothetical protein